MYTQNVASKVLFVCHCVSFVNFCLYSVIVSWILFLHISFPFSILSSINFLQNVSYFGKSEIRLRPALCVRWTVNKVRGKEQRSVDDFILVPDLWYRNVSYSFLTSRWYEVRETSTRPRNRYCYGFCFYSWLQSWVKNKKAGWGNKFNLGRFEQFFKAEEKFTREGKLISNRLGPFVIHFQRNSSIFAECN